ncbi:Uu.00g066350.m01.CDS01 [Anthostomella pinea]|uniref:Uu.00g066350.m01.CDS01 n=1 Tax=Anthostomella pinea TaxID=933095 RepID=A0AAI8VUR8_9PEZI|nr:Uu.00g066350.m01.CDS01 [Anthostomella pinea]
MRTTTLMSATPRAVKPPRRNDDRVILHFDYDCFYASVFENENPSLKSQPLGIKQKSILATCNYVARARGVRKLMLISDALTKCPDLVLMNGEDLTRFRDASKKLWSFLRAHSWNDRIERLGLDEVWMDVTDVVAYNREMLNPHALEGSFFQLDRRDPEKGFAFDGTRFSGCVQPPPPAGAVKTVDMDDPLCVRLMLASHLAGYLRHKLDEDFGYTSSGGISTNKVLAKLAGCVNKPNGQTTLLSSTAGDVDAVQDFMDSHTLRKVPGIGSRIAHLVQEHMEAFPSAATPDASAKEGDPTVRTIRQYSSLTPELLEQILTRRPGAERGSGEKLWNLLHGVDLSEVKQATDVPTQISIEDTYMTRPLQTPAELGRELRALAASLVRRMRVDLVEADPNAAAMNGSNTDSQVAEKQQRWLAYPKTLRLSTRTRSKPDSTPIPTSATSSTATHTHTTTRDNAAFSRTSRSQPLPTFIFSLHDDIAALAERLVSEALLPLFRRLHTNQQNGWNLALINICVTNMVVVATDAEDGRGGGGSSGGKGGGRDISRMFKTQEDKLREFTVYDTSSGVSEAVPGPPPVPVHESKSEPAVVPTWHSDTARHGTAYDNDNNTKFTANSGTPERLADRVADETEMADAVPRPMANEQPPTPMLLDNEADTDAWDDNDEGEDDSQRCPQCGHAIPVFAMAAHKRFHGLGD